MGEACFVESDTPLMLHKCVARFVSDRSFLLARQWPSLNSDTPVDFWQICRRRSLTAVSNIGQTDWQDHSRSSKVARIERAYWNSGFRIISCFLITIVNRLSLSLIYRVYHQLTLKCPQVRWRLCNMASLSRHSKAQCQLTRPWAAAWPCLRQRKRYTSVSNGDSG